jgi:hypothetical protein
MSHGSGSSVIPVAVFLALLLIAVLPVSAANVTTQATNVATSATTVATSATTVATSATTVATSATTATPTGTTVTVTQPTSVVPTANPTISGVETITTGSIIVYSSPTGASILIDGVYSGTTPKTVNVIPAGNHILRLELSGYYDYEGSIYVVPGQMAQGYGTLQPMNPVTSVAPTPVPTVVDPVIITVTPTLIPTQDPGLLGNPSFLIAIIGIFTVLIAAGVSLFIHLTPQNKE